MSFWIKYWLSQVFGSAAFVAGLCVALLIIFRVLDVSYEMSTLTQMIPWLLVGVVVGAVEFSVFESVFFYRVAEALNRRCLSSIWIDTCTLAAQFCLVSLLFVIFRSDYGVVVNLTVFAIMALCALMAGFVRGCIWQLLAKDKASPQALSLTRFKDA